jgi:toxin ParE1/3/4
MVYKVTVSLRAQKEIEEAVEYYSLNSTIAPGHFIESLQTAYQLLATNPFYAIRYKNIRAIHLKRFPFSLYFILDENLFLVKVLSCFHVHRNPESRPT